MRENRLEVLHTISNYDLPLFFFVSYVRFPLRLVFLHSGIFCDQLIESIYLFIADFPLIKEKKHSRLDYSASAQLLDLPRPLLESNV